MVGVQRVIKSVRTGEQQIAAAAEQAVLHLIVYIGYKLIARGLNNGEVEVYLLLKKLCENEVLSLMESLVIGVLELVCHVVQLVELLLRYVQRGLAGGVGFNHLCEIADLVIVFFVEFCDVVAAVLYFNIVIRRKLLKRGFDRRAAYAEPLCDAAFAYAASGHHCEADNILQNKLMHDVVERHERVFTANFFKLLAIHKINSFKRY